MKKNILIIVGNYEKPSSVAINLKPFIESLILEGHDVDIITNGVEKKILRKPNLNVYVCENKVEKFYKKRYNNNLINFCFTILKKITTVFLFLIGNKFFLETRYIGWSKRKSSKLCRELHKNKKYDLVMSVTLPFKSNKIAYDFAKKENVKWYIFSFDPFSENFVENDTKIKQIFSKRVEKKYFSYADKLLLTPELINFYKKTNYSQFESKMFEVSYATLNYFDVASSKFDFYGKDIVCVYSGRLYKDIRNPAPMLKVFSAIKDIDLFVITDYEENKFNRVIAENSNIHRLNMGNFEYGISAVQSANILINIGNTVPYQVPGKIFELMSTGKPIIHFSLGEADQAIKYLSRYPLCLIIDSNNINDEIINRIELFCKENLDKRLNEIDLCDCLKEYYSDQAKRNFVSLFK